MHRAWRWLDECQRELKFHETQHEMNKTHKSSTQIETALIWLHQRASTCWDWSIWWMHLLRFALSCCAMRFECEHAHSIKRIKIIIIIYFRSVWRCRFIRGPYNCSNNDDECLMVLLRTKVIQMSVHESPCIAQIRMWKKIRNYRMVFSYKAACAWHAMCKVHIPHLFRTLIR